MKLAFRDCCDQRFVCSVFVLSSSVFVFLCLSVFVIVVSFESLSFFASHSSSDILLLRFYFRILLGRTAFTAKKLYIAHDENCIVFRSFGIHAFIVVSFAICVRWRIHKKGIIQQSIRMAVSKPLLVDR